MGKRHSSLQALLPAFDPRRAGELDRRGQLLLLGAPGRRGLCWPMQGFPGLRLRLGHRTQRRTLEPPTGMSDIWYLGLLSPTSLPSAVSAPLVLPLVSAPTSTLRGLGLEEPRAGGRPPWRLGFEHLHLSGLQSVSLTLWHIRKTLTLLGHLMTNRE